MKLIDHNKLNPCIYKWVHNNKIVYIGKTQNMRLRYGGHIAAAYQMTNKEYKHKKYIYLRKYFDKITMEYLNDEFDYEIKYIRKYNPILNNKSTNILLNTKKKKSDYIRKNQIRDYAIKHKITYTKAQKTSIYNIRIDLGIRTLDRSNQSKSQWWYGTNGLSHLFAKKKENLLANIKFGKISKIRENIANKNTFLINTFLWNRKILPNLNLKEGKIIKKSSKNQWWYQTNGLIHNFFKNRDKIIEWLPKCNNNANKLRQSMLGNTIFKFKNRLYTRVFFNNLTFETNVSIKNKYKK